MLSERGIRINQLAEANGPIVNRIRSLCGQVTPFALDSLSNPDKAQFHIERVVGGIARFPEEIEIRGVSLDLLELQVRAVMITSLKVAGLMNFLSWHERLVEGQKSSPTVKKITDRSVGRFIEKWAEAHEGHFPEPDWEAMEETHEKVTLGEKENLYGPYVSLFRYIQASAVEQFIEDTLPPEFPFFNSKDTVQH